MSKHWIGKFIGKPSTKQEEIAARIQLLREFNKIDSLFLKMAPGAATFNIRCEIQKRNRTIKSALRELYEEPLMNKEWAL